MEAIYCFESACVKLCSTCDDKLVEWISRQGVEPPNIPFFWEADIINYFFGMIYQM